ncbi:hypothetical protein FRX31_010325, partial [Thalictrum thalictroides]
MLLIGFHDGEGVTENSTRINVENQQGAETENFSSWPNEIHTPAGSMMGLNQDDLGFSNDNKESPKQKCGKLLKLWIETGLLAVEELKALGLQQSPTGDFIPTNTQAQATTNLNGNVISQQQPEVFEIPNSNSDDIHFVLPQSTLVINDGTGLPTTNPRRCGCPLGSTNKMPKINKNDKGKGPLVQERCDEMTKKRKIVETIMPTAETPPYILVFNSNLMNIAEVPANFTNEAAPSSFSFDFIRQLLLHPVFASLLAHDSIINLSILSLIPPITEISPSPLSIFHGLYVVNSDDEYNEDNENHTHYITDVLTVTDNNNFEILVYNNAIVDLQADLGSIIHPANSLLCSSSARIHTE